MNWKEKTCVLFDLDGTLTDPADGITRSVQHALAAFGLTAPREELLDFIGPPLADSFIRRFGFTEVQAAEAIRLYREYFSVQGIYENQVYPGIPELLKKLRAAGKRLFLATSKPEIFARKILVHFGLEDAFEFAGGSTLDSSRVRKGDVIRYVLEEAGIDAADAVMVGDREHDVLGAAEVGIPCVGVLYGYGSRQELQEASAAAVVVNPLQLERLLTEGLFFRWLHCPESLQDAFAIREAVFVREQGFVNEFDQRDNTCDHVVLYQNDEPIGCARLFPEADTAGQWHVGRIAVMPEYRGEGLGAYLLQETERRAREAGGLQMALSAQVQAQKFYEKQGYKVISEPYLDEHCPHVDMIKSLI